MGVVEVSHYRFGRDPANSVDLHHALGARVCFGDTIELCFNRFQVALMKFQLIEFKIKFASPKFGR